VFILGLFVELVFLVLLVKYDEVDVLVEAYDIEDWVVYSSEEIGCLNKDVIGVAAVYSYGG
jgi:hypothetical protein